MRLLKDGLLMKIFQNFAKGLLLGAMALAATAAEAAYVGNPIVSGGAVDGLSPLVILGEYNSAGPTGASTVSFPSAGSVSDVQFYGGNYNFTLYALAPGGLSSGVQTFTVAAAESFSGSASTGAQSLAVSGFSVAAGDLLAFAGIGPQYVSASNATGSDATYADAASSPGFVATPPSRTVGSVFTVESAGTAATYDYIANTYDNQGRTYTIGVDYTPVPIPASVWLMLGGLGGLGLLARRRIGLTIDR
jgi:hypothetical protein